MSTDQAELVHQLQATLSKMEVALGAIADAVVFLSADSQVQWCNSAFEQLVKRSHSTLVGSKFSELLPLMQAGQPVAPDAYPDVKMRRGEYEATEYELVQSDRSLVLHISGNCMEQSDRSTVLVIRDITPTKGEAAETRKVEQEQGKQAEEALRESEERYRRILETTYEGAWIIDADGKTSFVNPRMAQMLGYTVEEMLGKHLFEFMDSEGQAIATAQLEHRRQGIHENHDFKFCRKDGSDLWTIVSTTAIFDHTGQYTGALAMLTDISDRKRVEEALKASEARLSAILSSAVACIQRVRVYAHRSLEFEYSSPGSELIYGYTAEEILADNYLLASRVHPEDWETVIPKIFESIFAEQPGEYEYRHLHPDGSWRWICFNVTSVRDEAADCWITTAIAIDISDKKRAEIALAESELKFRSIVENANDILAILSPQGIVRYVSPNVVNVLGYTPAELEGESFAPLIHLDDLPKIWEAFNQLATTDERVSELENRAKHKDGSWKWICGNLSTLRDTTGNLLIVSVTRDITERKQAEEALKASEARFNAILNSALACIARYRFYRDRDWDIEYCSPASIWVWGYSAEEYMADKYLVSSRIHPEDWEALYQQCFDKVYSESLFEYEYRYNHPDGTPHWISIHVTSVRDEAADCWLVTVIATDITDKKRTEIALAESELKFRTIVENANDVIGIANLEGTVRYISPNVVNWTGFTAAEMEGQSFESFIHSDEVPKLYEAFNQLATTGERISGLEYRAKHKDGHYVWQLSNLSCFRDVNGELLIIGVVRDITERKQAEEALKASEARLNAILNSAVACIQRVHIYADRTWDYEYVSPGSELIFGYTAEELLADNNLLASKIHPKDWETIVPQMFESVFAERPAEHDFRYLHPKGNWRWIHFNVTSVRDEATDCWITTLIATDITDKKQTEIALAESEFKFRSIVENANDMLGIINQEGIILYSSPNIFSFLGYTPNELEGQTLEPFVHPDDLPELWQTFNRVATTQERIAGIEYRGRHKNGSWRWHSNNLSAIRDSSDNLLFICLARDITERKQAEEALAERARLAAFRADVGSALGMSDTLPVILNCCAQAAVEHLNATFARIWTFNPKDDVFELKASAGLYTRLNGTYSRVPITKFFIGRKPRPYITNNLPNDPYVVDKDWVKREGLLALACYPIMLEQELLGIIVIFARQKLSESTLEALQFAAKEIALGIKRKQAEAALEYRAKVESLLSSISRHFIDQDVDTAINFTLEAIANFIGCDRSYIFELFDDLKQYHLIREWCAANIPARADDGRVGNLTMFPWVYEQMLNHQAIAISSLAEFPPEAIAERATLPGQSVQSMLVVPMTHSDKVVGSLGVDVVRSSKTWTQDDINFLKLVGELIAIGCARHKAEEALLVAKEAAEAANRAKSTFLANMSHELRTPLNAILGFAQLLERDTTLTSRQRDSLAIINRSGEHLLNLINDVLEMSKIEAGRLVLSPEPVNLHRLLQTLQEMFQVRTQAKRLSLRFELAPDLPQCVLTDEGKLRQVLINLLSNAVKFTETGGITLRARAEQGNPGKFPMPYTLFFEVEDTGKGIASEEMGNLFQPFVQTTSGIEAREGTGLGLTISRQFIRLMGGDIYLTSTVGKGSTFRFDIQATLADAKAVAPTLTHGRVLQLAPDQPTYRILVVDDRPEGRDLIAQLLDTVGFETRTATNGQEAIQQWQQWHPHLIWMDMRMPVMDGYEATRQIREQEARGRGNSTHSLNPVQHQPTVIIALTASAFEEQRASILAAGCDDFVRKPFREQVIFEKMAEYLGVRYVYEQNTDSQGIQEQTSRGDGKNLTSDDLAVMPADWVTQLHQASLEVDADQILQLIEQIPATHLALAEGLTDLVRRFCFDEILELSE